MRLSRTSNRRKVLRTVVFFVIGVLTTWFLSAKTVYLLTETINYTKLLLYQSKPPSTSTADSPPSTNLDKLLHNQLLEWCCDYEVVYSAPEAKRYLMIHLPGPRKDTVWCNYPELEERIRYVVTHRNEIYDALPRQFQRNKSLRFDIRFAGQIVVSAMSGDNP